jgi:hypothetical protein
MLAYYGFIQTKKSFGRLLVSVLRRPKERSGSVPAPTRNAFLSFDFGNYLFYYHTFVLRSDTIKQYVLLVPYWR